MRTEQLSPITVTIFMGIILLFIAFYMGLVRVDAYLRYTAIDQCAASSKFEKNDKAQSAIISYPLKDVYQACLVQKGLASN